MKTLSIMVCALTLTTAVFAQKGKTTTPKTSTVITTSYTCTMHPEVIMDKPGKCPKCGMTLTASKKEQMKTDAVKTYCCPMHADVVSNEPGKCPKCGMNLTASKKEQMKTKEVNGYSCPMHPDETSTKPGKCPKCGMDLTKKN